MSLKLPFLIAHGAIRTAQASVATYVTLAHRMPMLALGLAHPRSRELPTESVRMVTEKMHATVEGAMAGHAAASSLAMRMAQGKLTPLGIAEESVNVALAAVAPAQRKVRANARRLSKKK